MTNRYAIIENGLVTNVVLADSTLAEKNGWVPCPEAGPGASYVDGVFTDPLPPSTPAAPTKEELTAQLAALSAQIQALE